MKYLCVLPLLLAGCAGTSTYSVRPFVDAATGTVMCCEATVTSSKDVTNVSVNVTGSKDGSYTLSFQESKGTASAPITAQVPTITGTVGAISQALPAILSPTNILKP